MADQQASMAAPGWHHSRRQLLDVGTQTLRLRILALAYQTLERKGVVPKSMGRQRYD